MQGNNIPGFRKGTRHARRLQAKASATSLDATRASLIATTDGPREAIKDGVARAHERWGKPTSHLHNGDYKQAMQAGGGLVNVVLTVTLAAVIAYIGIFVMQETQDASGVNETAADVDPSNASGFDNASFSVSTGVESGFSLFQVVIIALMLGIIVTALVGLRPS